MVRIPEPPLSETHENQHKRVVMSVQIKKDYSIIEMTREATPQEIDYCKLLYCGHGCWNDKHVQENIRRVSYHE